VLIILQDNNLGIDKYITQCDEELIIVSNHKICCQSISIPIWFKLRIKNCVNMSYLLVPMFPGSYLLTIFIQRYNYYIYVCVCVCDQTHENDPSLCFELFLQQYIWNCVKENYLSYFSVVCTLYYIRNSPSETFYRINISSSSEMLWNFENFEIYIYLESCDSKEWGDMY
jgi:hypothetical protein